MSARNSSRPGQHFRIESNRPGWITLAVTPALESKELIAQCLRPHLDRLPEELVDNLLLAVDELVGNAMEHGCGLNPDCWIQVSLIRTERVIIIYVRDEGEGFSIGNAGHAAVNNPPDNPLRHTQLRSEMGLRPGGFGIMLARKAGDDLIYNQHGNAVMLLKYLS